MVLESYFIHNVFYFFFLFLAFSYKLISYFVWSFCSLLLQLFLTFPTFSRLSFSLDSHFSKLQSYSLYSFSHLPFTTSTKSTRPTNSNKTRYSVPFLQTRDVTAGLTFLHHTCYLTSPAPPVMSTNVTCRPLSHLLPVALLVTFTVTRELWRVREVDLDGE